MLRDIIVDKSNQKIVDGVTYSYDTTRAKWLSVGRCNILYGINHTNINSSRWLAVTQGIYSNNIGYKVSRQGTITAATIQAKNTTSSEFMIMRDNNTHILTLTLDDEVGNIIDTDVEFAEGTLLRCFLKIIDDNRIDYPFVNLECASIL